MRISLYEKADAHEVESILGPAVSESHGSYTVKRFEVLLPRKRRPIRKHLWRCDGVFWSRWLGFLLLSSEHDASPFRVLLMIRFGDGLSKSLWNLGGFSVTGHDDGEVTLRPVHLAMLDGHQIVCR